MTRRRIRPSRRAARVTGAGPGSPQHLPDEPLRIHKEGALADPVLAGKAGLAKGA